MKPSIAISLVILAAAIWIGRDLDRRIVSSKATAAKLAEEARKAGIAPADTRRAAHRPSEAELASEAHAAATAYLNDPKARKPVIVPSHEIATDAEIRIRKLDPRQMEILLEDLLAAMESDPEITEERVASMMQEFARKRPRAVLELSVRHSEVLLKSGTLSEIVRTALSQLAKDDGPGAVSWMREHRDGFPEAVMGGAVYGVFRQISEVSPKLALELSGSLRLNESETHDVLHTLISAARTNEARTAALDALRECRDGKLGGEVAARLVDQRLGDLGQELQRETFESASRWLDGAGLTDKERNRICGGLAGNYANQGGREFRPWIGWMGRHLTTQPRSPVEWPISNMMNSWTEQDHEAAGKWLTELPDGRLKEVAVMGFVGAVAPYDLESALQWLETLPNEQERAGVLKSIHFNLPKKTEADKQAAAAFAKEHGLE